MSLRTDLNAILTFIGAESLTDDEYDAIEGDISSISNHEEVYTGLGQVLDGRESVSNMADRLTYYYLAKGISFSVNQAPGFPNTALAGKSNIYVGGVIED